MASFKLKGNGQSYIFLAFFCIIFSLLIHCIDIVMVKMLGTEQGLSKLLILTYLRIHFIQICLANGLVGHPASHKLISFDCVGSGAPAFGVAKYADPTNCQQGVYCVKLRPFLVVCPPGTFFNTDVMDCDVPENIKANCDIFHIELAQQFAVQPLGPGGAVVNDCSMQVSGHYPLAYGECSLYLRCTHGRAVVKECNWNQLFDIDTNECRPPSKTRCWMPPSARDASLAGTGSNVILATMYYDDGIFVENGTFKQNKPQARQDQGNNSPLNLHVHNTSGVVRVHGVRPFKPKKECGYQKKSATKMFEPTSDGIVITSFGYKNDGEWQTWQACPPGTFINGLATYRRSKIHNGLEDNVGIITISFQCQSPKDMGVRQAPTSSLPFGPLGVPPTDLDFNRYYTCEEGGVGVGFQINSEKDQEKLDDLGTANVRILCSCGPHAVKPYWKPEYHETSRIHGEWLSERYCQPRQAICAANAQMHEYIEHVDLETHDNTGLNNIKVKCCNVTSPALTCVPREKQILIAFCNNSASPMTRQCEFDATVGTAYDYSNNENLINFYESIGFTRDFQVDILTSKLSALNCGDGNCMYDWGRSHEMIWRNNDKTVRRLNVPPRWNTLIYQVIGECGYYIIHTNKFMRHDTDYMRSRESKEYFELL